MKTIGRHLIVEFYRCQDALLDDLEGIRRVMLETAEVIGATVMGATFHRFTPQGVSGTVVISESHLSVHTWPEYSYVSVDIYTCGGLDPRLGFRHLEQQLGARESRVQEILRGLPEELAGAAQPVSADIQVITRMGTLNELISDA
ncbi:MAG: adenosylmethionine decarboxylase [Acidobacteria bacterium]|nr:MAG: adenosylmethionine decarboxylase [Acidobacteriota bacterium]TDI47206.1 MAG: adenosylmethionine decarboxylase [Acidobacteriota bacterium]